MLEGPALIASSISAVAAAVAAVAAWRATGETRRAAQSHTVATLRDEYASSDMLEAIGLVKEWKAGLPIALDGPLDRARRRVSHHFQNIVALVNADLLDQRLLPVVILKNEADLFCEVIQSMDKQINSNYDRTAFERIERLYAGHPHTPALPGR